MQVLAGVWVYVPVAQFKQTVNVPVVDVYVPCEHKRHMVADNDEVKYPEEHTVFICTIDEEFVLFDISYIILL